MRYFTELNGIVDGFYVDGVGAIPNGAIELSNEDYKMALQSQSDGKVLYVVGGNITPTLRVFTPAELLQAIEDAKPKVVSMRQARLALLQTGQLKTITDAIATGTDEAMKIEWEYATEVRRNWASLIALTDKLGMTSVQLDEFFLLASTL